VDGFAGTVAAMGDGPVVDGPVADGRAVDGPVAEGPEVDRRAVDRRAVDRPAAEERAADFPAVPGRDDCHIWAVTGPEARPAHEYLLSLLDTAERARAARFRDRAAGEVFVVSRAAQRVLAGRYLGLAPATVTIERNCQHCGDPRHGRPRIAAAEAGEAGLDYSVTHTGELLLLAYVTHGLVGIDVEAADRRIGTARLARYALTPAEAALVSAAPRANQAAVFCRLWTRKEALVKLTGHGLAAPLSSVDVTADTVPPGVSGSPPGWPASPVTLTDLELGGVLPDNARRYIAAAATTGPAGRRITIRPAATLLAPPATT
jgi:4'-phosphopantetheinyl transferase